MSSYIFPVLVIFLLLYAHFKKVNVYTSFVDGAKGAINLCVNIFPYVAAIMCAVAIFRASGLAYILIKALGPIFKVLGIPTEVCEIVLLRPFTGSGSFALLNDIYLTYGVDTYISKCASCIMGSSETLFYVSTVYTSKTSIKRLSYAIPVGICANIFSAIIACLICKFI